ncbi:hypothetical protein AAG906_003261 [Vitis piasezkii]
MSFPRKIPTTLSFPTCKRCFLINRGPLPVRRDPNSKPKPSRWFRPSTQCPAARDSGGPSSSSFSHFTEKISRHFQEKIVIRDGSHPTTTLCSLGETLTLNLTLAFVLAIDARPGRRGFGGSYRGRGGAAVPCLLAVGGDDGGTGSGRGGGEGGGRGGGGGANVHRGGEFPKIPSMPISPEVAYSILRSLEGPQIPHHWKGLEIISSVNVDCGKFDQVFNLGRLPE